MIKAFIRLKLTKYPQILKVRRTKIRGHFAKNNLANKTPNF